ncbi:unnamed protein product [Phytophthora fragariaefolia]|uniref:Unnamed protein product n=1 Tax=Phytophthora fragariaefolia TaxID=1490495 RepID=A0A9W6Y906_9STRA|nr:unnamed protein product [Phytophthora fragariaefolia]
MPVRASTRTKAAAQSLASTLDARLVDFGHLWRQMKAAEWTSKRPTGLSTMWAYYKPSNDAPIEGENVFYAVVQHAIETGLIQDDENCASGGETGVDADENARHNGRANDEEISGGDRDGGEMVRASQINCCLALSDNTVEPLFGNDSEDGEPPPALSQNAIDRAFELSQPGATDTINTTEQTVVIGAFQRLRSEREPDTDSGDDLVEETNDDRGLDDDGGPLVPRNPADVNLMKPGDPVDEYGSLCSDSDYGQFSNDDYVEPIRHQLDKDGSSDDEESPHMDAAFIEALGGSLSIEQMDKSALRDLRWSAASSEF